MPPPPPPSPADPDDDAAALVGLLARLHPPAGDLAPHKRRLLEGVAALIDADTWSWALTQTPDPADPLSLPVPLAVLDGGWTESQKARHVQAQQSPHRRVFGDAVGAAFNRDGHATFRRPDILSDADWRASAYHRQFVEPIGLDEFVISARHVAPGAVSGLAFYRRIGRPPFTNAQTRLVRLLVRAVPWLAAVDAPAGAALPILGLSPRERQVMQLLQTGDGRKQIATKLRISPHTVDGYLKAIYRRFGVTSRGELQARFLSGRTAE